MLSALPAVLLSGYKVLRAMIIDVVFEALPPWVDIPPAWGPLNPKMLAKAHAVVFSITERAGDTWKTWSWEFQQAVDFRRMGLTLVFKTAKRSSETTPT